MGRVPIQKRALEKMGQLLRRLHVAGFALLAFASLLPGSLSAQEGVAASPEMGVADQGADAVGGGARKTFVIPLEGPIVPNMRSFLDRKLAEADSLGAEVIVLDIHSPGGRLDTTFEIIELLGETDQEVVAYIRHSAFSGAAMIALASDRIEMHPEAQLGDVGVIVGGPFSAFQYVEEKERSPVVSKIRTLAESKGRPAALAEAMVDMDVKVFKAENRESKEVTYFTDKELESLEDKDQWTVGPPILEAREDHFLTVSGARAVELGLAEDTSRSLDSTLDNVNAERPVTVLAHTWIDSTIEVLNSYWMTGLLLLIGLIALAFELSSPGLGIGGLTALLCFALFFWSRFLGGTAGWLEVTLFLTSLAFIAAEIFVLPGFGVAGVTGIFLMLVSLVMASSRVLMPANTADWTDLGLNVFTITAAMVGGIFVVFFLADYFQGLPLFKGLVLEPPKMDQVSSYPVGEGKKDVEMLPAFARVGIGDLGRSVSPLRPSGKALFADDLVDVTTEGEFIPTDSPVRVLRKQGSLLVVREA